MENEFIKLIVSSSNKKAERENMTEEERKNYINGKLFKHFEESNLSLEQAIKIYKSEYSEFEEEKFKDFVIKNTSRSKILQDEKEKLQDKIKTIDWEMIQTDRKIGNGEITRFDLSCITDIPIKKRIDEIYNEYLIEVQEPKNGKELSEEQKQEYNELIEEMTKKFKDVEQLHKIAKEQSRYFKGMGKEYQQTIKEKSPEYAKYIDSSIEDQTKPLFREKEILENKKNELKNLKEGLETCIEKIYDPRIKELEKKQKEQR